MNKDEIKKLAELSRISIKEEDLGNRAKEIGDALGYVNKLNEIEDDDSSDTDVTGVLNVMIADKNPHESGINTEILLKEAPQVENNFVKVKKIL